MADESNEKETPDEGSGERRRPGWAEFRRSYPGLIATMTVAVVALLAMDGWILAKRARYDREITRLRASMTEVERQRADQLVAEEENKLRVAVELIRRQAQLEKSLHLSVTLDSSAMYLEREGALLREMPVLLGPERSIGIAPDTVRLATPRGVRSITRILGASDTWEVPEWVYADRGMPVPADRSVRGALGAAALLLDGGTVIYTQPASGPLADSSYVLPGAVRAREQDLRAIMPNLSAGVRVYFY